jgi:hypothetical protein
MVTSKNSSPDESAPSESTPAESRAEQPAAAASFVNRHRRGVAIAAAAVAVVVVSGLTAWGVGTAVASSYESSVSATVPSVASAPPTPAAGKRATARGAVIRGTIESISGSTWTIRTAIGAMKQVTVDSATRYGTKKVPAVASDFVVGTRVLVSERSRGGGEVAVRVVMAKQGTPTPTATPTTTS